MTLKLTKYLYWPTLALLIYMPFHIFLSQWLSTFTGELDAWKIGKDIFTVILVTACAGGVLLTRKYTKTYLWLLGLTIVYMIVHFTLLFYRDQPLDTGLLATVYNVRLFWYLLIGYSVMLLFGKYAPQPKSIVKILLAVSTVVCLIALAQWFLPKDIMTHFGYSVERGAKPAFFIDDKPDLPRVMSTIRDPNSLGAFLILPITVLTLYLVRGWKTNRRMFLSGLLLLHLLVLWLTFSRGAVLGLMAALLVLSALKYRAKIKKMIKKYWIVLLAAVCLLSVITFTLRDQYIVQNVLLHSDENTQLEDSNELHLRLAKEGLASAADEPLGYGPGTAGLVSVHSKNVVITENYFIQILHEVGVLGLGLLLALMAIVLKALWQLRRDNIAICLLASFIGLTVMNMLFHTWANEAVACAWWLIAGILLGAAGKKGSEFSQPVRVRRQVKKNK